MKDETIEKVRRLCESVLPQRTPNYGALDAAQDAREILAELDANLGGKVTPESAFEFRTRSCDADHAYDSGLCKDCTIEALRAAMHFAATHGKPSDYEETT